MILQLEGDQERRHAAAPDTFDVGCTALPHQYINAEEGNEPNAFIDDDSDCDLDDIRTDYEANSQDSWSDVDSDADSQADFSMDDSDVGHSFPLSNGFLMFDTST